jgi:hypothetical protein
VRGLNGNDWGGHSLRARASISGRPSHGQSIRSFARARASPVLPVRVGAHKRRGLDGNAAEPADQPIGGFRVQMFVRNSERADDSNVLAILRTPVPEQNMIVLVAGDRERAIRASVGWAARLPRVGADLVWIEPGFLKFDDDIGNSVAHHRVDLHVRTGSKAASYDGYIRQKWDIPSG